MMCQECIARLDADAAAIARAVALIGEGKDYLASAAKAMFGCSPGVAASVQGYVAMLDALQRSALLASDDLEKIMAGCERSPTPTADREPSRPAAALRGQGKRRGGWMPWSVGAKHNVQPPSQRGFNGWR